MAIISFPPRQRSQKTISGPSSESSSMPSAAASWKQSTGRKLADNLQVLALSEPGLTRVLAVFVEIEVDYLVS